MATLTYKLEEVGDTTIVYIREDFTNPISDQAYADTLEEWKGALSAAKDIAEQ